MSYDLQFLRDRAPRSVALVREHAIYREAQRNDPHAYRARNVADILERGHKAMPDHNALLVDVKA